MNIDRWKLIGVTFIDNLRNFGEMFRDFRGALLHDQIVLISHFFQEELVVVYML